jgi:hypothetical protein
MKSLFAFAGMIGALLVEGCATAPLTAAGYDGEIICNTTRMGQTESMARRSGTKVVWVRCPRTTIEVPQLPEREVG